MVGVISFCPAVPLEDSGDPLYLLQLDFLTRTANLSALVLLPWLGVTLVFYTCSNLHINLPWVADFSELYLVLLPSTCLNVADCSVYTVFVTVCYCWLYPNCRLSFASCPTSHMMSMVSLEFPPGEVLKLILS